MGEYDSLDQQLGEMKPRQRRDISREILSYFQAYKPINYNQNVKYASELQISDETGSESLNSSPDLKKMQKKYGS